MNASPFHSGEEKSSSIFQFEPDEAVTIGLSSLTISVRCENIAWVDTAIWLLGCICVLSSHRESLECLLSCYMF